MAAATDYLSLIVAQLWEILEGNAAWAAMVPAGNRIKFNAASPQTPVKESLGDADVPQAIIRVGPGKTNLFVGGPDPTFGLQQSDADPTTDGTTETEVRSFLIELTSDTLRFSDIYPLLAQTKAAMRRSGAKLSGMILTPAVGDPYDFVTSWRMTDDGGKEVSYSDNDAVRRIVTLSVELTMNLNSRDLL